MKKVVLLVFMVLILFVFTSCDSAKFVEVQRITFTSSGVTNTFYPQWYLLRGEFKTATKDEYDNSEFKTSVLAPSDVNLTSIEFHTSDLFGGNIYNNSQKPYKPHGIADKDIGKYFFIYAHDLGHYAKSYYKTEIKGVGSVYIQVKVINDTTIIIRRGSQETTYIVTSYSIVG